MIKKRVNQILDILSVTLILCAVIMLGALIFHKEGEVPNIGGYSLLRVMTGSMEPTIHVDELLVVKQVDSKEIAEGDVISFYSRSQELYGQINTHRVVEKLDIDGSLMFRTKGDANDLVDQTEVQAVDLVGKVIGSSYVAGRTVRLIANPIVFILLIAIPLLFIFIANLVHVIRTARKLADEEEEKVYQEIIEVIKESKTSHKEKDGCNEE